MNGVTNCEAFQSPHVGYNEDGCNPGEWKYPDLLKPSTQGKGEVGLSVNPRSACKHTQKRATLREPLLQYLPQLLNIPFSSPKK